MLSKLSIQEFERIANLQRDYKRYRQTVRLGTRWI